MNILFVSSQFPNPAEQNKGVFSLQIVKEVDKFANLRVIAPVASMGIFRFLDRFKKYKTNFEIPAYQAIGEIEIYHPPYSVAPKMGFIHHLSIYKVLKPLIEKLNRERKIDAVNCHWIFPDGVAVHQVCQELGLPLMLTALGTDLNYYATLKLRKKNITKALLGADKVSVLSKSMYEKCLNIGVSPQKLVIIPNGVDLTQFDIIDRKTARKKINIDETKKMILFVGSLVPVKSIDCLFQAFAHLLSQYKKSDLTLYLIGSGFLLANLKKMAEQLKINSNIEFVGSVVHAELLFWMNAADCLCLPSLSEGHPNVMMEALACGTPVVASSVGSIPDFIHTQNGMTTKPSDPRDIFEKLDACLKTDYDRKKIRDTLQHHDWKDCAKQYFSEIQKIV
ncbi:MAG: glycosyltransferase family 4 protein [Gammaproteobacteria bacterium]|nr:glycosyltransferase family 4 protein [Gammaproteobacteria bacterium]